MKQNFKLLIAAMTMLFFRSIAMAQIPVEVFAGDKKATVDILFFRFIKNKEGHNSNILFFNRNRAGIDYKMTKTTNLPQFGFTEALSYNHEKLKGFALVAVVSILNKGVFPKAGVQYAKTKKSYSLFTWLVSETIKDPNIDFFLLARYSPKLTDKLSLFSQLELVNAFPTAVQNNFSFTQRFRLGLKTGNFQFGAGIDLSELGRKDYTNTINAGGFLRYEF